LRQKVEKIGDRYLLTFGYFGELDNYGGEAGGQRQSRRGGAGLIPVMARIVINP